MAINACYPCVPAIREAFKDEVSVAERMAVNIAVYETCAAVEEWPLTRITSMREPHQ